MAFVSPLSGIILRMKFTQSVAFANHFISEGYIDVDHTLSAEKINDYLSTNKHLFRLTFSWPKLPFVKGDTSSGYWFNKEDLIKYKTKFKRIWFIISVIALGLLVLGTILLLFP